MDEALLSTLETPCIVVNMQAVRENIASMQAAADRCGVALRPHIKTHKMPRLALLQIAAGARGITCAKVSEAEVMADAGIEDIFIAYPVVGPVRIARVLALSRRIRRLIVGIDSLTGAELLSAAAAEAGISLEVRLEIDTGKKRTGIIPEKSLALAQAISSLPALQLTGIYTFKSLMLEGKATTDIESAAREEGELMHEVAGLLRREGIPIEEISAGSSPTGVAVAQTGLVTEIRPGTYIFGDCTLLADGVTSEPSIAARIYATVVSVSEDHAVIDGGTKTFPTDTPLHTAPYHFPGYAIAVGRPDLLLTRMNEEHGMLVSSAGAMNLRVGQVLEFLPLHVCTAINLQNAAYLYDEGTLTRERIAARGMLL